MSVMRVVGGSLRDAKVRWLVLLGVLGLTAGAGLLTATAALAITGTQPGNLIITPAQGATTVTATWSSTTACPAGFQGSAQVFALNTDGSLGSSVSPIVAAPAAAGFGGTFSGPIGQLISLGTNVTAGGTSQFVVLCFAGAAGSGGNAPTQSIFVKLDATGANYTTSATGPAQPVGTNTALTASPSTPQAGATVTLTATVTPQTGTTVPVGSVQFSSGGTNIGTPVAVNASGVATTTTTAPATVGTAVSVSAAFTPTDATAFGSSTGSASFTVAGTNGPFGVPVTFTVGATGAFTFTANTNTVTLTVAADNSTGTGNLNGNAITVSDTRNTTPGWSVSGQESNFAGSGTANGFSISGNQLGWTPTGTPAGGATLGATVAPGSPGLGTTAGTLASAHAGSGTGTSNLSANLLLAIPAAQHAGQYAGTLTLTAVDTLP